MDDKNDLLNICRSSRLLRHIAEQRIYKRLNLGLPLTHLIDDKWSLQRIKHLPLYTTLQLPHISSTVVDLRIELPHCSGPPEIADLPLFLLPWRGKSCPCNGLDHHLGRALQTLTNLAVLHVACFLCSDPSDTRHLHLGQLKTNSLRELLFSCRCSPSNSAKTFKVLGAPPIKNIESLDWNLPWTVDINTAQIPQISQTPIKALLEDPEFLPNLKTLKYDRNSCLDQTIAIRPITSLSCRSWNRFLHDAIRQNGGTLLHLRMSEKWYRIQLFIQEDPTPYRNLRHIGNLWFMMGTVSISISQYFEDSAWYKYHVSVLTILRQAETILADMRTFECLPYLTSIEVLNHLTEYGASRLGLCDPWNERLMIQLHVQHPTLRRVFLKGMLEPNTQPGYGYWVWEALAAPPPSPWRKRESSFRDWTTLIKDYISYPVG